MQLVVQTVQMLIPLRLFRIYHRPSAIYELYEVFIVTVILTLFCKAISDFTFAFISIYEVCISKNVFKSFMNIITHSHVSASLAKDSLQLPRIILHFFSFFFSSRTVTS